MLCVCCFLCFKMCCGFNNYSYQTVHYHQLGMLLSCIDLNLTSYLFCFIIFSMLVLRSSSSPSIKGSLIADNTINASVNLKTLRKSNFKKLLIYYHFQGM